MSQNVSLILTDANNKNDYTGWPNKNRTFLSYHMFEATIDIIMWFLLKCSEITAENNKREFFLNECV